MMQKTIINGEEIRNSFWNEYQPQFRESFKSLRDNCFNDKHLKNEYLPTIRIAKISLRNFKGVESGDITLNCGKRFVPYGTESDILGLYGQNGSGKTALINALEFLRMMLLGVPYGVLSQVLYGYVKADADYATISTVFDLQYRDGRKRKVIYEFSFKDCETDVKSKTGKFHRGQIQILNEKISMGGDFEGREQKLQPVIDTSKPQTPFASVAKQKMFIGSVDHLKKIKNYIKKSYKNTGSFVFMNAALKLYKKKGAYSEFYQVLLELNYFAFLCFFVIGTQASGMIRLNIGLAISTILGDKYFYFDRKNLMEQEEYEICKEQFRNISIVLEQLVPGMSIGLIKNPKSTSEDGRFDVDIVVDRNGMQIPIKYESDGTRRLISVMSLFIQAFGQQSTTVVIDEFDAGIFEFLLGELLSIFQDHGKGQLIFTAHNLRPLEVLDKKFLYFTTTNPKECYTQLKHIGKTNNMRDTYFREILLGSEDNIYKKTKRHSIIMALHEAYPFKDGASNNDKK